MTLLEKERASEELPLRLEGQLAEILGLSAGRVEVQPHDQQGLLPRLRCVLPKPVTKSVSLVLRVHSAAGIPLASAPIHVRAGDEAFETGRLVMLAMEGYAHLTPTERQIVERRVWSRRAFATGSTV